MKLWIGAGEQHPNGWKTLDADPKTNPDVVATIPPLPKAVKSQEWEQIAAIHFLEHLSLKSTRKLLKEIYSVLIPGGVFILELPDISYCARVLLGLVQPPQASYPHQYDLAGFFGDPRYETPLQLHRWGYTPGTMAQELQDAGFERIDQQTAVYHHAVRDFRLEAHK